MGTSATHHGYSDCECGLWGTHGKVKVMVFGNSRGMLWQVEIKVQRVVSGAENLSRLRNYPRFLTVRCETLRHHPLT